MLLLHLAVGILTALAAVAVILPGDASAAMLALTYVLAGSAGVLISAGVTWSAGRLRRKKAQRIFR